MSSERVRHIARIDKQELAGLPQIWGNQERGRYLRRLLDGRGIDTQGLFHIEYYPHRSCWLLYQDKGPGSRSQSADFPCTDDEQFFLQTAGQLRRAARVAFAAAAAKSIHFASHGSSYELPQKPVELSAAALADFLSDTGSAQSPVRFSAEGGWQTTPSEN